MQGSTLLLTWRSVCNSHLVDFEEDKKILECENCELKDFCFKRRSPFTLTDEEIIKFENKLREKLW